MDGVIYLLVVIDSSFQCYLFFLWLTKYILGFGYFTSLYHCNINNKYSPFNNPMETYRYYSLPFCQTHSSTTQEAEVAEEESGMAMHRLAETQKREGGLRHKQRMGESSVGDRRESSLYEISFGDSVDWRLLCKEELDPDDLTKFKDAIHNNYFFEMFVEDLPMWGYIGDAIDEDIILGESEASRTFLFPHLHFVLGYKDQKIVSAKVTTDVRIREDHAL